jgi:hypothetical protein
MPGWFGGRETSAGDVSVTFPIRQGFRAMGSTRMPGNVALAIFMAELRSTYMKNMRFPIRRDPTKARHQKN